MLYAIEDPYIPYVYKMEIDIFLWERTNIADGIETDYWWVFVLS